jgi:hypothetical protein
MYDEIILLIDDKFNDEIGAMCKIGIFFMVDDKMVDK